MKMCNDDLCDQVKADMRERIAALEKEKKKLSARELGFRMQITKLEKVAEAAEQSIVNKHGIWVGPTVIQTLRAAGYLGEGNG